MQKSRNYGADILRGISLILITHYHFYQFKGTYIGVIVFFALSGYLVTDSLLKREFSYVQYWKKKISKLYPLLLFTVLFSTLLILILEKGLTDNFRYSAISTLFALSNIYQGASEISYFESHAEILPLVHTWALSLEMQFYIFYPFMLYYLKKKQKTEKEIAKILFLLANISFLCMLFHYYTGKDFSQIYYGTDTRLFTFFIAGALCSYLKNEKLNEIKRKLLTYLAISGCLFIFFFSFLVDYTSSFNYIGGLYIASFLISCSIAACFYLNFLCRPIPYIGNFIVRIAQHGYSYYLWQYIIMIFANEYFKWLKIPYHTVVLLEILILILVSEASYFWIERCRISFKKIGLIFLLSLLFLMFLPKSSSDEIEIMKEHTVSNSNNIQKEKLEKNSTISYLDDINFILSSIANVNNNTKPLNTHKKQLPPILKENQEKNFIPLGLDDINSAEDFFMKMCRVNINIKPLNLHKTQWLFPLEEKINKKENLEKNSMTSYSDNITFIGDSVMKMCEENIKLKFLNAYIDAAVSRQFSKLPSILKKLEMQGRLSPIVVIHLGSNGTIQEKDFTKAMGLLKNHQVYFINTVVPKPWERGVNHLLNEKAKEYSNVKILDWYQFAKGKSKWFYRDATHPKPIGAEKYSQFIFEALF